MRCDDSAALNIDAGLEDLSLIDDWTGIGSDEFAESGQGDARVGEELEYFLRRLGNGFS